MYFSLKNNHILSNNISEKPKCSHFVERNIFNTYIKRVYDFIPTVMSQVFLCDMYFILWLQLALSDIVICLIFLYIVHIVTTMILYTLINVLVESMCNVNTFECVISLDCDIPVIDIYIIDCYPCHPILQTISASVIKIGEYAYMCKIMTKGAQLCN